MNDLRLTLARALAWSLLLAGWVGLGGVALALTPDVVVVHALVALWLLALGIASTVATRDTLSARSRRIMLLACAGVAAAALWWSAHDSSLPALLVALAGWAAMTATASGVVRSARLARPARPEPPIVAASLGALVAAGVLGDPGDAPALALRLAALLVVAAIALALLQTAHAPAAASGRCRAGLFDCSLPAWPAGAWRDARQWPTLLAGLAMLPMMATLPLMVVWCRGQSIAPQAMVLLHFAAMFAPALILRKVVASWSPNRLSLVCAVLLAAGASAAVWADSPYSLLGVALAHGGAWSLAWAGQLWSPARRGLQGSSPWRAAIGYAALTMIVGIAVEHEGPSGLAIVQAALGVAAALAWAYGLAAGRSVQPSGL